MEFPRELTRLERTLLFAVLPENKPGYAQYRTMIEQLVVTGYGRFEGTNFVLGRKGTIPDTELPSAPVFALGRVFYEQNKADIVIHEELDGEIEYDISFENDTPESNETGRWSYSEWNPGESSPEDHSLVKETNIVQDKFILAIAPLNKKIWLHVKETGVNLLIPVTNFYNYLMVIKNIRIKEKVFNPSLLFSDLSDFSDDELRYAFIAYNKYFKRIKMDYSQAQSVNRSEKSLFNIFKRGLN